MASEKFKIRQLTLSDGDKVPSISLVQRIGDSLHLNNKALELLKTLNKPVAVLSICGPLRSGKSTFMSLVAGSKEVFKTSAELKPCTNGIWLSTTALECDEYILLFVDTEGINAVRQADSIEPVVSLIFLISSQLIYNMMHIVMQSDVSQISIFAHIAKGIMKETELKKGEVYKHFPQLVFLVRDCDLDAPEGKSKNEYLLETIMEAEDQLSMFGHGISVATLPHPSNTKDVSSDLPFMKEFGKIKEGLLQKANQNSVKGPILADLIGEYVDTIRRGKYPKIETRLACIDNYLKTSANQLAEEFCKKMKDEMKRDSHPKEVGLPVIFQEDLDTLESSECSGFDESLVGCYLQIFRPMYSQYVKDAEIYAPKSAHVHLEHLKSKIAVFSYDSRNDERKAVRIIGGHLQDFDEKNFAKSQVQCNKLSQSLLHDLKGKADSFPEYSLQNFEWDSKQAIKELTESAKGPAKEEVLGRFTSEAERLKTDLRIKQRDVEHGTELKKISDELREANCELRKLYGERAMQTDTVQKLSERNKMLSEENERLLQARTTLITEKLKFDEKVRSLEVELMHYSRENEQLRRENEESMRPPRPSLPKLVRDGLQHDSITIQWFPLPRFSENERNCWYDVEISTSGEASRVLQVHEPNINVPDLKFKTKYQFQIRGVRVVNGRNITGDYSEIFEAETKDYIPIAPENLQSTERHSHTMTLTWDPSDDPKTVEATEGYVITYRKRGSSRQSEQNVSIDKEERVYQLTNLQRYRTYVVKVGVKTLVVMLSTPLKWSSPQRCEARMIAIIDLFCKHE